MNVELDSGLSIHERMIAILDELVPIGKTQRNEQQKFMFRGHDDILNALNPLLAKHGVLVVPDVLERVTAQRTTASDKVMFEVNLHVRYRFYGAAGDVVEASTWGEGTDMGDKATNKAMTMAFKNVLNQAFAISSAEFSDPDGATPDETVARGNGAKTGGSSSSPQAAQPAAGAASSHPQAGSAAPAFIPPDSLGLKESRADNVPVSQAVAEATGATDKQKALIQRLAKKLSVPSLPDLDSLGKRDASALIEQLKAKAAEEEALPF